MMRELLAILAFYLAGAAMISVGVLLLYGLGVFLIIVGGFSLSAAVMLSRGMARVPTD